MRFSIKALLGAGRTVGPILPALDSLELEVDERLVLRWNERQRHSRSEPQKSRVGPGRKASPPSGKPAAVTEPVDKDQAGEKPEAFHSERPLSVLIEHDKR